ncbi:MAG: Rieske 2Fe-2S domain-containing protein [Chloroflexi bacterium]|nr:Rieske 2Fe-2S domain-containing protein [Chloroflexota bacterium]
MPPGWGSDEADAATLLDRLTLALLPLRLFLGVTFLYAGVDKLIDPTFLRVTGPGSIGSQLTEFVRVSPIAPLVQVFGLSFPVQVGFLIAVAEIAIWLGALTGLLFRLSAAAGLALSITFWLTASWATRPYYYGPDLPYAFGWLTVALAGTGDRFTIESWFRANADDDLYDDEPASPERRAVLRAGFLGLASLAVAAFAGTVGASVLGRERPGLASGSASPAPSDGSTGAAAPSASPSAGAAASPAPTAAGASQAPASGPVIARVSQLGSGRAISFADPISGDPGVLLKLADGKIVAFDAICTHAGCTVEWDPTYDLLVCPCHGAAFDPAHDAQAVAGPTSTPLSPIPIHVDTASGRITVSA